MFGRQHLLLLSFLLEAYGMLLQVTEFVHFSMALRSIVHFVERGWIDLIVNTIIAKSKIQHTIYHV